MILPDITEIVYAELWNNFMTFVYVAKFIIIYIFMILPDKTKLL